MSCKDCNDCKCTDPWHKSSPVQEYEDRRSISRMDWANLTNDFCYGLDFEDLQEDRTEELRDDVSTLRRRLKELEQQIAKELR